MGDWISAAEAQRVISNGPQSYGHGDVILRRAFAGLIAAKASRITWGKKSIDDVEIDPSFWWGAGSAALRKDWLHGDFETTINRDRDPKRIWLTHGQAYVEVSAFGVEFARSGIELLAPSQTEVEDEPTGNPAPAQDLRSFYSLFVELNTKGGKSNPGEDATLLAAQAFFPRNSVTRIRIRELRGAQVMGRPRKVAE